MVLRRKTTKIAIFFIGLILFVFGVVLLQFWADLLLVRFYKEVAIQPGTLAYKRWTGAKDPLKAKFYFWNWTNPEQIDDENVKPHFVEMGPYVFWQYREKVDLNYNTENATITYRNKLSFYFDPKLSNGSLGDKVTSINAIGASAAYMTKTWSKYLLYPISVTLSSNGQQVWWTKNVGELLFEGFENPVLKISNYIPGFNMPDKFAYYYGMNNTAQPGIFNVDSGANDVNNIGKVYFYDYKNESDVYPDCKEIKGTNSDFFPPFVTPDKRLEVHLPEACRVVFHYYIGDSTYEGLNTYIFGATKNTFDNGSIIPENRCYYSDEDDPPTGAFDFSKCRKEAPIVVSLPHFLFADQSYLNGIEGMKPDEMRHIYYEMLEPITGLQVNTTARFQVNVRLTRNPGLSLYSKVPDIYIPVFWQEVEMFLKGEYISMIQVLVFLLLNGPYIWYATAGAGILMILLIVLYHLYDRNSLDHVLTSKSQENTKEEERETLRNVAMDEKEMEMVKYVTSNDKALMSNAKDWL